MVIVLSIFNGLGDLMHTLNNAFDPEVKIIPATGKSFPVNDSLMAKIKSVPGVEFATEVIEDYAYARYRDRNQVVTLKGVGRSFVEEKRIPDENMVEGKLQLWKDSIPLAIVGSGVRYTLSMAIGDNMYGLQLYYIKNQSRSVDPSQMYTRETILPAGVFSIVQTFDENYVIVPLEFAERLMNYSNRRTAIEIKASPGTNQVALESKLQSLLGDSFTVLNHEEQHKDLYRLLKMEKLFAFLALSLLLLIGSINIFFSLMMLALDKKKDISVLSAIGASPKLIRNIFLAEGLLISIIGTSAGLLLGAAFCWLQTEYGLIGLGMQSAVIQGYPVKMEGLDFLSTLLLVGLITFVISIRPASVAARFASVNYL